MRLGIVGWACPIGMGRITFDFIKPLPVVGVFLMKAENGLETKIRLPVHILQDPKKPGPSMEKFINDVRPDTILSWEETREAFVGLYAQKGIRWIHGINWDVFDERKPALYKTAKLIAPNRMCQRNLAKIGLDSSLLPMPIDMDLFPFRERNRAHSFLTVYRVGTPTRRALDDIIAAWNKMQSPPPLTVTTYIPLNPNPPPPKEVTFKTTIFSYPSEVYALGDVLVQPSRFEGIGLTLLEAQSAGLPVITVNAEPMSDLAPDLLLPAEERPGFNLKRALMAYHFSPADLAEKVSRLQGSDISELSRKARARVENEFSWKVLRQKWNDFVFQK